MRDSRPARHHLHRIRTARTPSRQGHDPDSQLHGIRVSAGRLFVSDSCDRKSLARRASVARAAKQALPRRVRRLLSLSMRWSSKLAAEPCTGRGHGRFDRGGGVRDWSRRHAVVRHRHQSCRAAALGRPPRSQQPKLPAALGSARLGVRLVTVPIAGAGARHGDATRSERANPRHGNGDGVTRVRPQTRGKPPSRGRRTNPGRTEAPAWATR